MLVSAPNGRGIAVQRRWFPWRVKKRNIAGDGAFDVLDFADGIEGLVFGLIFAILIVLFGGIIFFGFELIVVLILVIPLLAVLRMFWVLPWVIEARNGDTVLHLEKVRGWRTSQERIQEIADAYRLSNDPVVRSAG